MLTVGEETKKNKGGGEGQVIEQMKLDPQNKIKVKHSNRLSDKKQRMKVKGKGETRQDQKRPVLGREERIDFYPQ